MTSIRAGLRSLHGVLDQGLAAMGTRALPVLIALLSGMALLAWVSHYDAPGGRALHFSYVQVAPDAALEPRQALAQLQRARAPVGLLDTRLSEDPFWLLVPLAAQGVGLADSAIEFGSRHASELSCWNAETLQPLGRATRSDGNHHQAGEVALVKAGFGKVYWLDGGIGAWQQAELPLAKGKE